MIMNESLPIKLYIQLSMYCIFSDRCLRPKILSFDPAWEPSIYCTRIKSPESNFEAYDFWLAEGTKKLQILLESYMIQLFKNVSSFSVSLANHKLKKHKCMKPATLPRGFKDFQIAKIPITLEWMMSKLLTFLQWLLDDGPQLFSQVPSTPGRTQSGRGPWFSGM